MSTESLADVALERAPSKPFPPRLADRIKSRLMALSVLGGLILAGLWLLVFLGRLHFDGFVAPIHLSPQNDQVLELTMRMNRQTAELERLEAEVARIEGDLEAVETGIERLSALRHNARASLTWQARMMQEEGQALDRSLHHLREERRLLDQLHARQLELTEATREDLRAGLVDRTEMEQQEQALDRLEMAKVENQRQLDEATARSQQVTTSLGALEAGFDVRGTQEEGRQPEVAAGEEHEVRLQVELLRLQAEQRGLEAHRRIALAAVERERATLEELQDRPLYRAMQSSVHVAFVPYGQLDPVEPGARVMACTWGLILCQEAGRVSEVLSGEVFTHDPWGTMARGKYAILELDDPEAIEERVLRIRGS